MRKPSINLIDLAREIVRVTSMRERLMLEAFELLKFRHALLAQTLVDSIGSQQRAAHWMCMHQRAFDGRNAYEALANGEEDSVWEQLPGGAGGVQTERLVNSAASY
jgi:hypothetical protein